MRHARNSPTIDQKKWSVPSSPKTHRVVSVAPEKPPEMDLWSDAAAETPAPPEAARGDSVGPTPNSHEVEIA